MGAIMEKERRSKEDVAVCSFCGEKRMGYVHLVAGRIFCELPSQCSAEWAEAWAEHLRKTEVA